MFSFLQHNKFKANGKNIRIQIVAALVMIVSKIDVF
jgi:hypothetical protein